MDHVQLVVVSNIGLVCWVVGRHVRIGWRDVHGPIAPTTRHVAASSRRDLGHHCVDILERGRIELLRDGHVT